MSVQANPFKPVLTKHNSSYWSGLHGCGLALAACQLFKQQKRTVLLIAASAQIGEQLLEEISFFSEFSDQVKLFPDWECLPYDQFSPHQEIISSRLSILSSLNGSEPCILIVTLANLMQKLPPVSYIAGHSFKLNNNDQLKLVDFRARLQNAAYHSVSQVVSPGEYAIRGGLIDVFPMGSKLPIRIDLFDDDIETLKYFDPQTQLTTETITSIELLPAREFPLTDEAVSFFRQAFRKAFAVDPKGQQIYNDVSNHHASAGIEFYFPLFFEQTACLFDYIPEHSLVIQPTDLFDQSELIYADIEDRYRDSNYDPERKTLAPEQLYLRPNELKQRINTHQNIIIQHQQKNADNITFQTTPPPTLAVDPHSQLPYENLINYIHNATTRRILIAAETPGRHEALASLLSQQNIELEPVRDWQSFVLQDIDLAICVAPIERGLLLDEQQLEIICETQLYGERSAKTRKQAKKLDPESIIRSLAELNIGDPVVHENHGIGRYQGLQTLTLDENTTEFMVIEYQEQAKLYVPVLSLNLINRYTSGSPQSAPLHYLGSDQWEKIKKKAQEKAYDVAVELLEIQAVRQARRGFEFKVPKSDLDLFASSFDHQETEDQAQAIDDVIADMKSDKPMDRLVCGDVGFGKTEVAIRAAFVAASNSRQVAILVPTTLLAGQHFETFQNRFASQAINIQLLSRFKSAKQNKQTLSEMAAGKVDIVIGTHRLLQADINFNRLGLLILDEEHRFGVRQKERLKQLRNEVDILTLTATPIPRTLNQAMSSMRDISIISTAPKDRLSVQTFVREKNKGLIKEAIQREIRRGGQVYFLHNDVRTMSQQANELQELVPEIKISIGHGQMPELELENVMQDFYHRRFNVFVCSTIVESGIDNPSANTIIINRADRFGLAQLHQLRGRVGRSHHQAYAYLLIDSFKTITKDARKRLDAIASLKELGAGFTLASHDLEIRGAGELLGEAQSGTIDLVGFSLYSQYLQQAMRSINSKVSLDTIKNEQNIEIDIEIPALLPETFIPDVHMRLVFYKRIASTRLKQEFNELKIELADRFGFLPEPTKLLLELATLRSGAQKLGITRIQLGAQGGYFEFAKEPNFEPVKLIQMIQNQHQQFKLKGEQRLLVKMSLPEKDDRLKAIVAVINQLS